MPSPEAGQAVPVRMARVGVVAPRARLRDALVVLSATGLVDLGAEPDTADGAAAMAVRRLERARGEQAPVAAVLSPAAPDLAALERAGDLPRLLGEAALARRSGSAVVHGEVAGLVGWAPQEALPELADRLAAAGSAIVALPVPVAATPPTLLRPVRPARGFSLLVSTYGAARYSDLDPTPLAAIAFVVMFGMMFGDVGHGLLLAGLGLLLRASRRPRLAGFRPLWPLPVAAGLSAAFFGLLYGECFGPTGLVPTLWLSPTDAPERLLLAAVAVGCVLLAAGMLLGAANRLRHEGRFTALTDAGGLAGLLLLAGAALALFGRDRRGLVLAGLALVLAGTVLIALGFSRRAGRGAAGRTEAAVETFDGVIRVGANAVSFARLGAFGLTHAVIGALVLGAAAALADHRFGSLPGAAVLIVGTLTAFAIEAFVAVVQALRLEYYELFSRAFPGQGRPFCPWQLPVKTLEA